MLEALVATSASTPPLSSLPRSVAQELSTSRGVKMHYNSRSALLAMITVIAAACSDPDEPASTIAFGSPVSIGAGEARSYVISSKGVPSELGISLSESALDGLPGGTTPMDSKSFLLPLPAENPTGYQVVELNWNPVGHPPPMVYTVPHFDFHFYTTTLAARNAILPTDPNFGTEASNLPPVALRPSGYAVDQAGGQVLAIPLMGVHWTDPSGPEFHGSPFTTTFIYGSWNGHFTFVEPMVTRAFLLTHPDTVVHITQRTSFEHDGYHPSAYRVSYDAGAHEFRIGLVQLEHHSGTSSP